jgi:hypothetical protein
MVGKIRLLGAFRSVGRRVLPDSNGGMVASLGDRRGRDNCSGRARGKRMRVSGHRDRSNESVRGRPMPDITATYMPDGRFAPHARWEKTCRDTFTVGDSYVMSISEPHDAKTRAAYFATVNDVFDNLPEAMARQFVDATTLRKHALIETGWAIETLFVGRSKAEAQRHAAWQTWVDRQTGDYSISTVVGGKTVRTWRAKSQKVHEMRWKDFCRSVDDVLEYLAKMIHVDPADLRRQNSELRAAAGIGREAGQGQSLLPGQEPGGPDVIHPPDVPPGLADEADAKDFADEIKRRLSAAFKEPK